MKKILFVLAVLLTVSTATQAQDKKYEATWESIDSRDVPEWYVDAKFGIFVHWGLYSVPAFAKVGQYSEWYWHDLVEKGRASHDETLAFHNKMYGEGFTYPDFAPMFNCKMFNPDQWAKIFEDAGAKYVVLTSKHHDGYCLWDNDDADKAWGRPWNSVETGPRRDLIRDLTDAVRKTDVKMGLYFTLFEWYNPLYVNDIDQYVDRYLIPQFKDVVTKYSPSVIFSDGEWTYQDTTWRSEEMLSWLYNEASNKDEVVVNDRWGKETRHIHGGYYTTEYGSGLPYSGRVWEENRGMGPSFGYNRAENLLDYNSSQQLIYMLIDIVSRGGNFLLDVGPTADGRIPVIMQQRLADIGKWLKVNGEAIYGTSTGDVTCQWTDKGKAEDAERGRGWTKYDILKLTVNPDKGMARKEIFFTRKGQDLYGICPVYPKGKLVVKDVTLSGNSKVTMLGYDKPLKWKKQGKNIVIEVPYLTASETPCEYAWTFKMTNVK